jgi:glutamine amidotransferase
VIAIVDYDAGNTRSVVNALKRLGVEATLTSDADVLLSADRVLFPGVGHARSAMEALQAQGLEAPLRDIKAPFLGICLGMQLMCAYTEEGHTTGLGIVPTKVVRFEEDASRPVPHMGWNHVESIDPQNPQSENPQSEKPQSKIPVFKSPVFHGISAEDNVYFIHSYYAEVDEAAEVVSHYGVEFAAAIRHENYFGVQFHPEKSGEVGLKILQNFLELR